MIVDVWITGSMMFSRVPHPPFPPECNKRVVIATIERYRVLSSAIGKKKHERILFVVTRTIHLIIQPTRGCIIVALIIPITVQLSFTCNAGDVMHSLASTQWRENSFIGEAGRRANCFSSEIGRWNPLENPRHNRAGLTFYTNIYHVVQNNHCKDQGMVARLLLFLSLFSPVFMYNTII